MRRLIAALLLTIAVPASAQEAVKIERYSLASQGALPAGSKVLFSVSVTSNTLDPSGYFMMFPTPIPPADGAVVPTVCFRIPAGAGTTSLSMGAYPGSIPSGLSWVFSTGANCQTKIATTVNFVSIAYR